MAKAEGGKGGEGEEVRALNAKVPKCVHRALVVYATLKDQKIANVVALAVQRFLEDAGDPLVKALVQGRS